MGKHLLNAEKADEMSNGEYEFLKIAFKCARKVAAQRGWRFI